MKERPILFQGAMVRALLAGTKTQTRRAIKRTGSRIWPHQFPNGSMGWKTNLGHAFGNDMAVTCPYGQPGDRLWVREAWGYRGARFDSDTPDLQDIYLRYRADDPQPALSCSITCKRGEHDANLPKQRARHEGESYDDYLNRYWAKWRPGIHMPRWASRITLEITEVRVQRLQEISEADAMAEGIGWNDYEDQSGERMEPREAYRVLWDQINGAGSWDANPWVWAVSFRRVEP